MKKKMMMKNLAMFMCVSLLSVGFIPETYAMGKVDPSKVVNGASAPKAGLGGTVDRAGQLAKSGAVVAGHTATGAAKGAAGGAAGAAGAAVVGAAVTGGQVEISGTIVAGAAVIGGTKGACDGYQKGREAARYK